MLHFVKTEINQITQGKVWNDISLSVDKKFKYDVYLKSKIRRRMIVLTSDEKIEDQITQHVFEFCSLSSART